MTDRLKGFVVTLKDDIREDDAEEILTALSMVKGVIDVRPLVHTHDDHMARMRLELEFRQKLYDFIEKEFRS